MVWLYILVRTYPFWAIPTGVALIVASIRTKKGSKVKKSLYTILGIFLFVSSGYFLLMKGHNTAVPFVHQLFHGQR